MATVLSSVPQKHSLSHMGVGRMMVRVFLPVIEIIEIKHPQYHMSSVHSVPGTACHLLASAQSLSTPKEGTLLLFTDKDTEAQRGEAPCQRTHS